MDIISAIDQATGCHQCGNPLGSSPSSDFCSEFCQATWHERRTGGAGFAPRTSLPFMTRHVNHTCTIIPRVPELNPEVGDLATVQGLTGPIGTFRFDGQGWVRHHSER